MLYGALVGGPGEKDDFVDDCSDYQKNVRREEGEGEQEKEGAEIEEEGRMEC